MVNGNAIPIPFKQRLILTAMLSFCFPKTGLLQYLGENSDTQLKDTYNKGDIRPVQQSRAYEFSGSNWLEFGANFEVGDTLTYTKTDNTTDTVNLDANKRAFDGVAIRIFNYEINGHIFNCEDRAGNLSQSTTKYPTPITADIYGSLTGFHVIDHRKTTCYLDNTGFAVNNSNPDVAIPLALDGTPVASYDTMYSGIVPKDVDFVNASCFHSNGSDNKIAVDFTSGLDNWEYEVLVKRGADKSYSIIVDAYLGSNNGYFLGFYNNDKVYFKYGDGSNLQSINATIDNTEWHIIKYGIRGNEMYFDIDGVKTIGDIIGIVKSDFTINNLLHFDVTPGAFNGEIAYFKLNTANILIPFLGDETNKRVYNVNGATGSNYYDIAGAITDGVSWKGQPYYHNLEIYGYELNGGVKYPASLLNLGYSVLGNTLTHPHCELGSNDGSQKQQPLACDLIHADTDEVYFDKTNPVLVIAKELDNADLPVNGDYTTWNKDGNCASQGTVYDHDLDIQELGKIATCYAKSNIAPYTSASLTNEHGALLFDPITMKLLIRTT